MRVSLWHCNLCLAIVCSLYLKRGRAQLYFDPASFSLGSRGALSHALESGPRLPHFLVQTAPPTPPLEGAAAPTPSSATAADAATPAAEAASPAAVDELQEPLVDPGALYTPLQAALIARHGIRSRGNAPPPPPAPDVAAPSTAPTPEPVSSAAPSAAPDVAPGLNSSVNGSVHTSPTQIKDLLMPAPPAPPVPEPALPAPVPTPEPSAQAGNGRPKAGSKDSSLGTCEQQGQQGSCNACICCCSPKGSGGFVSYHPQGCKCEKEVHTSDIWLMLSMSAILLVPALLVSAWFAGLFPATPYRDRLYT